MSSTNKTTYYELPQFVDNDIFNPLVDDNDAYDKIDTALHNIASAEADDASEIVSIKSRLDTAEGDIDALETQNGNSVLTTTAQTLSGAINELDADVSALDGRLDIVEDDLNNASTGLKAKVTALETAMTSAEGDIDDLEAQNGNSVLTTTAQTLSGAINELDDDISALDGRLDIVEDDLNNASTGIKAKISHLYLSALNIGFANDGVTDNSSLFNTIFNSNDYEGKTIFFPAGTYLFEDALSVTHKVGMCGEVGTIFKFTTTDDYGITFDFTSYQQLNGRSCGVIAEGIIFDFDNKCSGMSFVNYLDLGVVNCAINNAKLYGINTRAVSSQNFGAQLMFDNVRFYHNSPSADTIAILDPSLDNFYNNIVVVDYQIAINTCSMVNNLHHWLSQLDNFSGSVTLLTKGGSYTNIYSDTVETAVKPTQDGWARPTQIVNMYIYNNSNINASNPICGVDFTDLADALVTIKNLSVATDLAVVKKGNPTNFLLDGVCVTKNNDPAQANYVGGKLHAGIYGFSHRAKNTSINNLYTDGWYMYDTNNPINDLPSGVGSYGIVEIISFAKAEALQKIYDYANNKIYFRYNANGSGSWKYLTATSVV